jgi:hypothetical protein
MRVRQVLHARPAAAALVLASALAGCGGAVAATSAPSSAPSSAPPVTAPSAGASSSCSDVVASTLGQIAQRIYQQAAHGRNVVSSVKRLARSRALARAVALGDAATTRQALAPLLKHQILRIVIRHHGRVLADIGRSAALAPVSGVVRDGTGVVGQYTLSVADEASIAGIIHSVTGATVRIRRGSQAEPSSAKGSRVISFAGQQFPAGALRISLNVAAADLGSCGATPAETVSDTVGMVGERLYRTEAGGAAIHRVLRHVASDRRFRAAVVRDDPSGLRTAIVRFFRTRSLHVVRVRATTAAGRLVNDVGGPDVLAPASQELYGQRRARIGRVTVSVQDDTGYIKLMHRFTGAEVLLRRPAGQVAGSSLVPGPATVPARGTVTYQGRTYEAFSFPARAFPSGPLTISLLLPS